MNALIPDVVIDRGTGLQPPDFSETVVPVKIVGIRIPGIAIKFCQIHCQAQPLIGVCNCIEPFTGIGA